MKCWSACTLRSFARSQDAVIHVFKTIAAYYSTEVGKAQQTGSMVKPAAATRLAVPYAQQQWTTNTPPVDRSPQIATHHPHLPYR